MKKINTIIIDSDKEAKETLKTKLSYFSFISCLGEFNKYFKAKKLLEKKNIDLIFLKIGSNNHKFIDIANNINSDHKNTQIVIISPTPKLAYKSYEAYPFDFLLEPVDITRLEKCLIQFKNFHTKEIDLYNLKNRKIGIKKGNSLHFLEVEKILKAECCNRKIVITLVNYEKFSYNGTLKHLEKKLYNYGFILVKRSVLLSIKSIKSIIFDNNQKCYILNLKGNNKIKINPEKYRKIKQRLSEFEWVI